MHIPPGWVAVIIATVGCMMHLESRLGVWLATLSLGISFILGWDILDRLNPGIGLLRWIVIPLAMITFYFLWTYKGETGESTNSTTECRAGQSQNIQGNNNAQTVIIGDVHGDVHLGSKSSELDYLENKVKSNA